VPLIAFRKSWDILHGTVVAQDHFQMITTGMASRSFHQQYENPRALLKKTGIGEFYMKMPFPLPLPLYRRKLGMGQHYSFPLYGESVGMRRHYSLPLYGESVGIQCRYSLPLNGGGQGWG